MLTTSNPSAALFQAVAFTAGKQRNHRRKDAETTAGAQFASVISVRWQPIDFPCVYSKTGILSGVLK
jgi:hypothetical protein